MIVIDDGATADELGHFTRSCLPPVDPRGQKRPAALTTRPPPGQATSRA
jgi:hypothetical protein